MAFSRFYLGHALTDSQTFVAWLEPVVKVQN